MLSEYRICPPWKNRYDRSGIYFVESKETYGSFVSSVAKVIGERVIPFATAGGTGKEGSYQTLKKLLPKSDLSNYFFTSKAQKADPDAWLNSIRL